VLKFESNIIYIKVTKFRILERFQNSTGLNLRAMAQLIRLSSYNSDFLPLKGTMYHHETQPYSSHFIFWAEPNHPFGITIKSVCFASHFFPLLPKAVVS